MICEKCKSDVTKLVIHKIGESGELWCMACHNETKGRAFGSSAFVHPDDIPGGLEIKHGICNDDGTPRKFYSKSAIREAAYEAGYTQGNDTPRSNPRIQEERAKWREEHPRW